MAKPTLLSLEHITQRLQGPVAGTCDGPSVTTIVEKRVHRLLQHPLFVMDDDIGSLQLKKVLQAWYKQAQKADPEEMEFQIMVSMG